MILYLAGQTSFGNRGCEALVRGTVDILRTALGVNTKFLVPSFDPSADAHQWPDHEKYGVSFVVAPTMPKTLKAWCSVMQRVPGLAGLQPPTPRFDTNVEEVISRADAVLMIGGDIISLDYGVHSLYFWSNLIDRAREMGKPTYLWAASVGPFESNKLVVRAMGQHLRGYAGLSVRESTSLGYLRSAYAIEAIQVGDPAFRLSADKPRSELGVDINRVSRSVGLNISPLIRTLATDGGKTIEAAIVGFLRWLVLEQGLPVTLLYHVDQREKPDNSDLTYLQALMPKLGLGDGCYCLPANLNACELKWIIAQMHTLVAARTHATVAAFSQGIPTISIGYSRKARALNLDLFGSDRYVINAQELTTQALKMMFDDLQSQRTNVRERLLARAAEMRVHALDSAKLLKDRR